jgi:hypothetical protein
MRGIKFNVSIVFISVFKSVVMSLCSVQKINSYCLNIKGKGKVAPVL